MGGNALEREAIACGCMYEHRTGVIAGMVAIVPYPRPARRGFIAEGVPPTVGKKNNA